MIINQSFTNDKATLYLVATPIGNLADITYRAVEILKSVDYILAEDTRTTGILLNHYGIKTKLISYHKFNEEAKKEEILNLLKKNKNIALVSDAGTPIICDPGYILVRYIFDNGYNVVSIPGACAYINGLICSGFNAIDNHFLGFLPKKKNEIINQLELYKNSSSTLIFYESPKRIRKTLEIIKEVYGNREISLARELTKKFETIVIGNVDDILKTEISELGEYVLYIKGNDSIINEKLNLSVKDHVNLYIKEGLDEKEAIKKVAKERSVIKNEIYQEYKINS